MLGFHYFKADASTFVMKVVKGLVRVQGKGLSFFYNSATTSIVAIPMSVQEIPFIFTLKTADFQTVTVQGQLSYQIAEPVKMAQMLNFTLQNKGTEYVAEDPLKLPDRVIRVAQTQAQHSAQATPLQVVLGMAKHLTETLYQQLHAAESLARMGIMPLDLAISAIQPTPETARALEAEVRELLLKQADDAIYARRKAAVEQERTIKEAELQTEWSIQQKQQEIEESRLANERSLLRVEAETERERLQASIAAEQQRQALVTQRATNQRQEADAEAYTMTARMNAFTQLPLENLKALASAQMQPEQLMALAFESLAQNAHKIGELNISPDLFGQLLRKSMAHEN